MPTDQSERFRGPNRTSSPGHAVRSDDGLRTVPDPHRRRWVMANADFRQPSAKLIDAGRYPWFPQTYC